MPEKTRRREVSTRRAAAISATLMRKIGAQFLRFSVLQKALRYKKLGVRGLASADCSKPSERSTWLGSAAFSRDDLSLRRRGEEKASREFS